MRWDVRLERTVTDAVGVPATNGVAVGALIAQALWRSGLRTSKRGAYAPPERIPYRGAALQAITRTTEMTLSPRSSTAAVHGRRQQRWPWPGLAVRVERHHRNALEVARWPERLPATSAPRR